MTQREHVKPLTLASEQQSSDEENAAFTQKRTRRQKCLKCCGWAAVVLLLVAAVIIALAFTVFKVKQPIVNINNIIVDHLELVNGTSIPRPGTNMSLIADVSVQNRNHASFKYHDATITDLFYDSTVVGEVYGPPGQAKARRTMRMNVTINIMTDKLMTNPNFQNDAVSGDLIMTSYTRVGGKAKLLNFIKKHVTVTMRCSMTVNMTSLGIQFQWCKAKSKL